MRHVSLSVWIWLGSLSVLCASASCSDNAAEQVPRKTGRLEVALTATSSSGVQYRLRNGTFRITGTATKTLSSDTQPDAPTLTTELAAGQYSIELVTGWSLQKRTASGSFESVKAALGSANPVAFTIVDQQTTSVLFRFNVGNDVVAFGNGRLTVHMEVDDCQPDAGDACAANAGGAGGAANDAGGSGGADAGGTTNEDGSTPDSAGGTSEDGGPGDAGAPGEDGGVSCLADGQCEGGQCTGGQLGKVCLLPRDRCTAHTDCRRDEYCDGAEHCVPAAGLNEPCSPGSRCGRDSTNLFNPQLYCDGSQCTSGDPDTCLHDEQCEEGTVCTKTAHGLACGNPISGDGARCDGSFCENTSWCTQPREKPFPICMNRPGIGESCAYPYSDYYPPCAVGAYCWELPDDPTAGRCQESPSEGNPCISFCYPSLGCGSPCAVNHYCDADNICRTFAALGQSCAVRQCAANLYCDPSRVCRTFAQHGESCETAPCATGLRCETAHVGGTCTQ